VGVHDGDRLLRRAYTGRRQKQNDRQPRCAKQGERMIWPSER
jgi:hypothetical protein